jgi:hypothetical protein
MASTSASASFASSMASSLAEDDSDTAVVSDSKHPQQNKCAHDSATGCLRTQRQIGQVYFSRSWSTMALDETPESVSSDSSTSSRVLTEASVSDLKKYACSLSNERSA